MSMINTSKDLMRYIGKAPESTQCRNCYYGLATSNAFAGRHHCAKANMFVASVAGCKEWQAKQPGVSP
jgi:hypothetical protein